ncbi:carbohydrate ABC transporter permease [Shouchella clausii]|uniref:carbohydrate ABC transporter permease n=1 Tax=Shouchella TaxID=2893057 RepID=UPI0004E74A89|nr:MULTISPECIES: carbohydrate ABC transporter permease [Shouchella]ALA52441.1 ABC-type sugar transport system, permease component [Shouchella clausii]MBU3230138.1 carbohydrate ABC transporter permease [Shouchella clausii]MBU3262663.1 carbohydrate ABC transporter permease [Shouchella clausii]MBU3507021.1 carbohydrate ABC transporter permease [Shouchella clausii]MBU3533162.1 carbohydrate ABC transporter permease [Shouchella clausii]
MNPLQLVKRIMLYVLAVSLLLFTFYPFMYMVGTSLKSMDEFFDNPYAIVPDTFTFEHYFAVVDMGLAGYFLNSLIITVSAVSLTVVIASLASYPLSRLSFRFNRPLFLLFVAGMMLPIHATLIPIFVLTQEMGIYDTLLALLGPYVAFSLPISIFILTQFMQEIPKELEEAAQIDGANHWTIFRKVIFPNVTPALSTIVIYNFVFLWTEFIFVLILLTTRSKMTLPLGLQNFYGELMINVPGLMAAITLASLPILLLFIIAQERVVKGLTGGALKG